ncbi:SatD family protein [Abyssalbus ytuae]|uniref:SatD family protein n=1 Tax=Abyssalbus ytuae TaxID=2926907 RepID=A0A9E6ZPL4_9FLAO|nr:SatD family protein [Abyssalbus ytuae]UOB18225.1 SatD family protein [Abyssalbus ytuae]
MTSVITGDIVNSRTITEPEKWLTVLKNILSELAVNDKNWEIYRGDSFQIEIPDIEKAFEAAVYIKAGIKMIKGLDVRMAIGIGNKLYSGNKVSESGGEAFVFSGEKFESLRKKKTNLAIKTPLKKINHELNLYFKLCLIAMNNWTPNSAEIVKLSIKHPSKSQEELGKLINIKQNTVSERQKRAYLEEIKDVDLMYREIISQL